VEMQYSITGTPLYTEGISDQEVASSQPVEETPNWLSEVAPAAFEEQQSQRVVPPPVAPVAETSSPGRFVAADRITTAESPAIPGRVVPPARKVPPRRSRPLVLEILVIALLLMGAVAALWMLRSSMPGKSVAPASRVEVSLSPDVARVRAGKALDLSATVTGAENAEVEWSVKEGDSGGRIVKRGVKAGAGEVAALAVYIAPATAGTYHVEVTSQADPQKSATAEITVNAAK
jgi:uncharacterized protein YjdB